MISYGLFYFVYKYYTPDYGGRDYYHYVAIYKHPLNFKAGDAPFAYRQLSAILTNVVWRLGIYRDTKIAFASADPRVFFAAIFANWLALVACATVVAATSRILVSNAGDGWSLLAGALCFFDFFAQQGVLAGLSEGVSWLLVAIGFLGWVRRSLPILATVIVLSIVQRETIPVVFGALSVFGMLLQRDAWRFHLKVLAISVIAILLYLGMRLGWPAPSNLRQLSPASFVYLIGDWPRLLTRDGLFQVFLTQNLLIGLGVAAAVAAFATSGRTAGQRADPTVAALYLTTVALLLVGVGALEQSNSIGRVLSILTPIAAPLFVKTLVSLFAPAEAAGHAENGQAARARLQQ